MKDFRTAAVQYGDFQGQVMIDGHSGPFVHELAQSAQVPEGYFPVGFRVYASGDNMEHFTVSVGAVKTHAKSVDELLGSLNTREIKVETFSFDTNVIEFLKLVKRLSIAVVYKAYDSYDILYEG